MQKAHRALGTALLLLFAAFLAWFMVASLLRREPAEKFRPRLLTSGSSLYGVSFPGRADGWAVGRFGVILHSDDGGKTWKRQRSGTTRALSSVSAAGARHAFAVGNGGMVLATSDGGRTWQPQTSGTRNHLLDVQALSPSDAFAVGAFGTLLSTTDGGRTWVKHALKWSSLIPKVIEDTGPVAPNLNSVFFVSAAQGWIVGEFGLILHTDDGGKTWNAQRAGSNLPQLVAVRFRDALEGFAVGQTGVALRTTDGGAHWMPIKTGTKDGLYGISLHGRYGVVVGSGVVLLTDNGGLSWSEMKSIPATMVLSSVSTLGEDAIAVGPGPTILPVRRDAHN